VIFGSPEAATLELAEVALTGGTVLLVLGIVLLETSDAVLLGSAVSLLRMLAPLEAGPID
jgi:hypothetical protein